MNVTIPYKEKIISFLDEISPEAQKIGAVNTIKIEKERIIGYNSDYYGFKNSLSKFIPDANLKALILGDGGASKAVQQVLLDLNIEYKIVSRRKTDHSILYENINQLHYQDHQLIINTTPLGMYPDVECFPPIDYEYLTPEHYCFDLVYNPENTLFMQKCDVHRAKTKNGLEMLYLQAEKSWEIWNS